MKVSVVFITIKGGGGGGGATMSQPAKHISCYKFYCNILGGCFPLGGHGKFFRVRFILGKNLNIHVSLHAE